MAKRNRVDVAVLLELINCKYTLCFLNCMFISPLQSWLVSASIYTQFPNKPKIYNGNKYSIGVKFCWKAFSFNACVFQPNKWTNKNDAAQISSLSSKQRRSAQQQTLKTILKKTLSERKKKLIHLSFQIIVFKLLCL